MQKHLTKEIMLEEIEDARKRMNKLAYENSLCSEEVIDASVKLDKLLNIFARFQQKQ
jgi:hypothetical protein